MMPLRQPTNEVSDFWTLAVSDLLCGAEYWADAACDRGVSGRQGHREHQEKLAKDGLKPIRVDESEKFIFGDGVDVPSICSYVYPVITQGVYRGKLRQAMVEVPCPRLLSKQVLPLWSCNPCFGKKVIDMRSSDIQFHSSRALQLRMWPIMGRQNALTRSRRVFLQNSGSTRKPAPLPGMD